MLPDVLEAPAADPIRVLYLEDNPADAALAIAQLRIAGFDPVARIVQTPEEFFDALNSSPFDVVLADYSLPDWNGMEALEIIRERGKDLPFILVPGSVGEQTAVACLKKERPTMSFNL